MEKIMQYLQIRMGDGKDFANKTKVSKGELLDIITDLNEKGDHFLVNLQCTPGTKAYLLVDTGFLMTAMMNADDLEESQISSAPLFFYPLGSVKPDNNGTNSESKHDSSLNKAKEDRMTTAQRRFLYRLLSEKKKLKGKQIEEYLKERFDVGDLNDIDKSSASQLIDSLLNGGE